MKTKSLIFLLTLAAACTLSPPASAQSPTVATHVAWTSITTGRTLNLTVFTPLETHPGQPLPVILYLENLATQPAGAGSGDAAAIRSWRAEGYLVGALDYAGDPQARVPWLNRDLSKLRDDLRYGRLLADYRLDVAHIFIVPAGSRLLRDVAYYHDGARTLGMDLIYPGHPVRPPAAIIEFSCDNLNRMGNTSLSICTDTMLDGEATEGFAVAMADHPVKAPYKGLDPMPECAWKIKAAVRTLRAEGAQLGLSGKIGVVGFSRGSGMALMLATTAGMQEFEGHGENPGVSSAVQAAVVMSGRFTYLKLLPRDHMWPRYIKAWGDRDTHLGFWRREGALDYLAQATIPLFLTINCTESPDALYQMVVLRQRLAELGNDEIFMMDREPRGHKVTLVPEILSAMNRYLRRQLD